MNNICRKDTKENDESAKETIIIRTANTEHPGSRNVIENSYKVNQWWTADRNKNDSTRKEERVQRRKPLITTNIAKFALLQKEQQQQQQSFTLFQDQLDTLLFPDTMHTRILFG